MYGIQEIQICMHIMIASIYITVRNYNEVMCAQVNGSQLVCNTINNLSQFYAGSWFLHKIVGYRVN